MSWWTYINGTVTVHPMGRTQAEKRYILETVLDHLPFVTGSERDMNVYIIQKNGYNSSSSHTEFGVYGGYLGWHKKNLSLDTQDEYILVVNGSFRDRMFEQTYKEFQKWLCRLAKRVYVEDVLVEVTGWNRSELIRNPRLPREKCWDTVYGQMHERPTWSYDDDEFHEPNWCEYLMWDRARGSDYPMMLAYKYFADEKNDAEVERRIRYEREE
jgi:hypothetical protein